MLGTIAVEGPESVVSTKYPDDPQSTLEISCEETGNVGPVLWTLDWTDDPNSVAWVAVPSTGLMDPGDTITVRRVSNASWLAGFFRLMYNARGIVRIA